MVTHVLFDLDGTLINTIDVLLNNLELEVKKHGTKLNQKIIETLPNLTSLASLSDIINDNLDLKFNSDEFKMLIVRYLYTSKFNLMPGVENIVKYFYEQKIPMAVATGNSSKFYGLVSKQLDFLPKYMNHAVCATDDPNVEQKPSPSCYLEAARRFKDPPANMEQVLVFEDSVTGLIGALASGAKTVLIDDINKKYNQDHIDIVKKANLIVPTLEHFDPVQFGLPPL